MNQYYINSICYIILAEEGEESYFNGYDTNLINLTCFFEKIAELPKDLSELFYDKEHLISNRISGIFNGYNVNVLSSCDAINKTPFSVNVVFVSSLSDVSELDKDVILISKSDPTNIDEKIFNIYDIDKSGLLNSIVRLIQNCSSVEKKYFKELKELTFIEEESEFLEVDTCYVKNIHTRANLSVLTSCKISYSHESSNFNFDVSNQEDPIKFIRTIKSHIISNLQPHCWLPQIDFVIGDMSNDFKFLLDKDNFNKNSLMNSGVDNAPLLFNAIKMVNQNKFPEDFSENKYLVDFYSERKLIEAFVGLRASSYISVCINLSLSNSNFVSKLKDIGVVDRSINRRKINKLLLNLVNEFEKTTDWCFSQLSNIYSSNIKLISNLPIEWAKHDGLPLMVRHEVSRIPKSPGKISTNLILDSEQVFLNQDDFKKVKIISSFSDDDPIKNDLKNKVELILDNAINPTSDQITQMLKSNTLTSDLKVSPEKESFLNISIDWRNVSNKQELIEALSDNDAAITVFDLHGGHSDKGPGVIKLKDEVITIYDLVGEVKISPIVILSSCDTSPIDKNHYTTSNALFLAGAKAVLASALPISSHEASIFIARLLLRIKHYLPKRLRAETGVSIRWSSFVTGMIRKTYYSELLSLLKKNHGLSKENEINLNFYAGCHLDPLHDEWHQIIMDEISNKTKFSREELNQIIENELMLPECLKYIQMGNPESIIIVAENHIPLAKKPLGA
ncbi:TPA: CHAT domain-containing protein [Vibrio parahaemolyticus]|uniref:CHAT domain-containing protein n=1 Tax=Vibrio parahaemolyticus TaxID=670 RepID=UPI002269820E|nr:CHAT domain-containing protein [Vibrio parahaemolyticus]MCX8924294.1 CHAT domain-containing protein [Vibrio parahaemolyticus]HCG8185229.1 CHAT domain-containing protein [Vibrio parahaemolyticus]